MTKRDLFGLQSKLIDDMKALFADENIQVLFDNLELYNLTLNQLESLDEEIQEASQRNDYDEIEGLIEHAINNAKEF